MTPAFNHIDRSIDTALAEDLGDGDITALLIDESAQLDARVICRETAVFCGKQWFEQSFHRLDPDITVNWKVDDGDDLSPDQVVCELSGKARALLSAERTALNFIQTLSATASVSRRYSRLVQHTRCRILDTRKTIPGLRHAQKYAVRCGGGMNHRVGLFDAYLIKENHLAAAGGISAALRRARKLSPQTLLEVEVETLDQLREAIETGCDRVLLDNFTPERLRQAVAINQGRIELEASGNLDEHNIVEYAETGIDYISIGALTKHVRAIDFSLRFID
jgi:nicotinate-nucleotide pyrophosphorylase (carboxylating)